MIAIRAIRPGLCCPGCGDGRLAIGGSLECGFSSMAPESWEASWRTACARTRGLRLRSWRAVPGQTPSRGTDCESTIRCSEGIPLTVCGLFARLRQMMPMNWYLLSFSHLRWGRRCPRLRPTSRGASCSWATNRMRWALSGPWRSLQLRPRSARSRSSRARGGVRTAGSSPLTSRTR